MTSDRIELAARARCHAGCWITVLTLCLNGHVAAGETVSWTVGDLFVGVGDGTYRVYDQRGGLKHEIRDEAGGYTTDCSFDPGLERLYTTNYTRTKVVVFDGEPDHDIIQTVDTGELSPEGHSGSIVFDEDGHYYVGHHGGNKLIHQYNALGTLLA